MASFSFMRIIRSRLFRLMIGLISLVLVATLPRSIYQLWQRWDIVSEREQELKRTRAENERLKANLQEAQTPDFVERQAREKLGMVKEGETLVIMPNDNPPAGGLMTNGEEEKEERMPNWKKWLNLFL